MKTGTHKWYMKPDRSEFGLFEECPPGWIRGKPASEKTLTKVRSYKKQEIELIGFKARISATTKLAMKNVPKEKLAVQKGKHWYKDPNSRECSTFFEGQQPTGWIRGRYPVGLMGINFGIVDNPPKKCSVREEIAKSVSNCEVCGKIFKL
jgi:hypothetical protein